VSLSEVDIDNGCKSIESINNIILEFEPDSDCLFIEIFTIIDL
jgi:hypothetical protein